VLFTVYIRGWAVLFDNDQCDCFVFDNDQCDCFVFFSYSLVVFNKHSGCYWCAILGWAIPIVFILCCLVVFENYRHKKTDGVVLSITTVLVCYLGAWITTMLVLVVLNPAHVQCKRRNG
jgi:hypothetical protein